MRHHFCRLCLAGLLLLSSPLSLASGASAPPLVGMWSTSNYYGELVNSAGAVVTSAYSGEWFQFTKDGRYTYTLISSGRVIQGISQLKGTYSTTASHKTVHLHQKTESWYPFASDPSHQKMYKNKPNAAENTLKIQWKNANEIRMDGFTVSSGFHRAPTK